MYAGLLYSLPLGAVAGASAFGWMVAYLRGPDIVAGYITVDRRHTTGTMIMFLLVALFVIVGDFIDAVPAIIIFMPIISKLAEVGDINPLHMGVVIITTLVFGLITPPYGLSLLVASKYVGVGFGKAVVRSLPLYIVFFLTIAFTVDVSQGGAVAAEAAAAGIGRLLQEPERHRLYLSPESNCDQRSMNPTVELRNAVRGAAADAESRRRDLRTSSSPTTFRDDVFRAIYQAFLRYQVLLFPPQDVPPARQVALRPPLRRSADPRDEPVPRRRLSRALSAVEPRRRTAIRTASIPTRARSPGTPTARGSASPGRRRSSTARSCPRAAARRTSATCTAPTSASSGEWKARIANMRAVHNLDFSRTRRHGEDPMTDAQRRETPPVDHPIVRTHPETGRKCLYLGDHAEYIVGMPYDEGRALIEELNALAIHPDLTYEHHWTARRADRLGQPLRDASRDRRTIR